MRQVGSRLAQPVVLLASGQLLAEGARFSESVAQLTRSTFIPKGLYRFKSHNDANRHAQDCLVLGMGLLAAKRS